MQNRLVADPATGETVKYATLLYRRHVARPGTRERYRASTHASTVKAGYRYQKEQIRRRREAPFNWERLDPWPTDCAICGRPIDPAERHGDGSHNDLAETAGHEPPVAWMLRNQDYDGPLVLRPEHWACNRAKRDRPDWEIAA